jgi:hypothetical protein
MATEEGEKECGKEAKKACTGAFHKRTKAVGEAMHSFPQLEVAAGLLPQKKGEKGSEKSFECTTAAAATAPSVERNPTP